MPLKRCVKRTVPITYFYERVQILLLNFTYVIKLKCLLLRHKGPCPAYFNFLFKLFKLLSIMIYKHHQFAYCKPTCPHSLQQKLATCSFDLWASNETIQSNTLTQRSHWYLNPSSISPFFLFFTTSPIVFRFLFGGGRFSFASSSLLSFWLLTSTLWSIREVH